MLNCLREYGLKLSPEKCKFFQTSVKFLWHIVSERGVETDPEKVAALKSWPIPTNLKTLGSFLEFAGYYHRFIKGYSAIAKPLNDLTRGYPSTQKNNSQLNNAKPNQFDPKQPFGSRWSPACQHAFTTLIEKPVDGASVIKLFQRKPLLSSTSKHPDRLNSSVWISLALSLTPAILKTS